MWDTKLPYIGIDQDLKSMAIRAIINVFSRRGQLVSYVVSTIFQVGITISRTVLRKNEKIFLLDSQTRQAKLFSQPINLTSAQPLAKPL